MANFNDIQGGDSVYGTAGADTFTVYGPDYDGSTFRGGDAYIHNFDPANDTIVAFRFDPPQDNVTTLQLGTDPYLRIAGQDQQYELTLHLDAIPTGITSIDTGYKFIVAGTDADESFVQPFGKPATMLQGMGGNDLFSFEEESLIASACTIDGGTGFDTVTFATFTYQVVASTSGYFSDIDIYSATFTSIEKLIGSRFGDLLSTSSTDGQLIGGDGDDTLTGLAGNDILTGDAGDDLILGGNGNNHLDGGAGTDTLSYSSASGGRTIDLSLATAQATGGGSDTISGFENLIGSAFADHLTGSDAANQIYGGRNNDVIDGGKGDDLIVGGTGNDVLVGGDGIDTVSYANTGSGVTIQLAVTTPQNAGSDGTDTLSGFENVIGSQGDDTISGNSGANRLEGGAGDDRLSGMDGDDVLVGGAGSNIMDGGAGRDTVSFAGHGGIHLALDSNGNGTISVGSYMDRVLSIENLIGSDYADVFAGSTLNNALDGGAGNDALSGRGGDDMLIGGVGDDLLGGGAGNDLLDGGTGTDRASYSDATAGVTVDLSHAGAQNTGGAGTDTLVSIEQLFGSNYADTLTGDAGNNMLDGSLGADRMAGGLGDDVYHVDDAGDTISDAGGVDTVIATVSVNIALYAGIDNVTIQRDALVAKGNSASNIIIGDELDNKLFGKLGNDTLTGGKGADSFRFDTAPGPNNVDHITDFTPNSDKIELAKSLFGAAGGVGQLSSSAFQVGTVAEDSHTHILYDSSTGGLFFDPDGNGQAAAVEFAIVTPGTPITAADFAIV